MEYPILEARDLKKSFPSQSCNVCEVLRSVNLSIFSGESISIVGKSGSGKTTLLAIVSGLEKQDTGQLMWQNCIIHGQSRNWQARYRAENFGFVLQGRYLVPELNVIENVILARRLLGSVQRQYTRRAHELLELVGLEDRILHSVNHLSGGEIQRVSLARALLNRPKLIFADEPTGNLDTESGIKIMDLLLRMCDEENTALLLVTHNTKFSSYTDRRLLLRNGDLEAV